MSFRRFVLGDRPIIAINPLGLGAELLGLEQQARRTANSRRFTSSRTASVEVLPNSAMAAARLSAWSGVAPKPLSMRARSRQAGADAAGYAGLEDDVDNHWGRSVQGRAIVDSFRRTQLRHGVRIHRPRVEHDAIMQAIAEGKGETAAQRMRAHMLTAAAALRRYIDWFSEVGPPGAADSSAPDGV